ncbi:MAG: glycerol-3-phosphate dehydrogenase/oxidase [Polyangiales bacterium]
MHSTRDRKTLLGTLEGTHWDLVVIGGGITGIGVLREAARRGLRVLLVEQRDYAWGTSSRSSKMVHGGLRYIAQGDIKLTRDALHERERLLREAPFLIERMGYWFGHRKGKFPGPTSFGILCAVYDFLAGIKDHRFVDRDEVLRTFPGFDGRDLVGSTRYTDSIVDDARLVLRVLDEALADGGVAINYAKVSRIVRDAKSVRGCVVEDRETGKEYSVKAACVVNATGAWADRLRKEITGESKVRPLRGSHLVFASERLPVAEAIVFQHADDKRPVFIFPWEGRTVVGTTDLDHREELDVEASISEKEVDYLLRGANAQFPKAHLAATDVISSWSGIRPVVASGKGLDPSQERRDHVVWDDHGLVTVTGGKLTTFRLIALDVLAACARHVPSLDAKDTGGHVFRAADTSSGKELPAEVRGRLLGRFGFLFRDLVGAAKEGELVPIEDTDTTWAELRFGARAEQVVHLDDLLLRRTRLGNLLPKGGAAHEARLRAICQEELRWDDATWRKEWERYQGIIRDFYSLPARTRA